MPENPADTVSPTDSLPGRLWSALRSPFVKEERERSELEDAIEEHREEGKTISPEERTILRNMLEAGDLTVSDIMVTRSDIVAVDYEITLSELKDIFMREQHTRMPVYIGSLDRLKGFIHLKDLIPSLTGNEPFDLDQVLREIYFISPSMRIVDLLVQMRISGHHMAIVVDEYGGTDGLVTLEDVMEALVGDIQDEHDVDDTDHECKRISSHQFEMDARIRIEEVHEIIGVDLFDVLEDEDDFETLGGFIFASLHRVPVMGEVIPIDDVGQAKILDADGRRIKRVLLTLNFTPLKQKNTAV